MKEVIVTCPYCGAKNHFYPPKATEIPGIQCISCEKLLLPVIYDLQLSDSHQSSNEKEDQMKYRQDIEEVE